MINKYFQGSSQAPQILKLEIKNFYNETAAYNFKLSKMFPVVEITNYTLQALKGIVVNRELPSLYDKLI